MMYELPTSVTVSGREYAIRSDYRAILDIFSVLGDPDIPQSDKAALWLMIFYPDYDSIPQQYYQEAINEIMRFINLGEMPKKEEKQTQLVHWEHDFQYIVSPVNKVLGKEIRALEYLHWWTFIGAYMEIGDCMFAQIIGVRAKKAKHMKLDKQEQEFYRQNKVAVDVHTQYSAAEIDYITGWA